MRNSTAALQLTSTPALVVMQCCCHLAPHWYSAVGATALYQCGAPMAYSTKALQHQHRQQHQTPAAPAAHRRSRQRRRGPAGRRSTPPAALAGQRTAPPAGSAGGTSSRARPWRERVRGIVPAAVAGVGRGAMVAAGGPRMRRAASAAGPAVHCAHTWQTVRKGKLEVTLHRPSVNCVERGGRRREEGQRRVSARIEPAGSRLPSQRRCGQRQRTVQALPCLAARAAAWGMLTPTLDQAPPP